MKTKTCTKCNVIKTVDSFHKNFSNRSGGYHLRSFCIPCSNVYHRKYKKKWSDKNKEYYQLWREENKETIIEYMKKWKLNNKEKVRESRKRYKPDPVKTKARQIVSHEIRMGRIVRPEKCSECENETLIEAHHEDYSKPLSVDWLCRICHVIVHQ